MPTMPVVSWEMTARDVKKQAHFYSELFGWKFEFDPTGVSAAVTTGGLEGSAVQSDTPVGDVYLYVSVPNVQAIVDKTAGLGGAVAHAATGPSEANPLAYVTDPEGSVWGIIQEAK